MSDNVSLEPLLNDFLSDFNTTTKRDLRVKITSNPVEGYHISDQTTGTTSYFGYVNKDGEWYIMKSVRSGSDITYTYAKGSSGYAAAWIAKATQTYQNFADIF